VVAIAAKGSLSLDAIVQFQPFHFQADVHGGFSVEVFGLTFCGVDVAARVAGPGPITVAAQLTIETFLHDLHWHETFTFGSGEADHVPGIADLLAELAAHAADEGVLTASAPDDPHVVLEPGPIAGVVLGPLGNLVWNQRRTPLEVLCDRLQGQPLDPKGQGVTAGVEGPAASSGTEVAPFAPGMYTELSEAEALHVPPFENHPSGLRIGFTEADGTSRPQPPAVRVLVLPVIGPLAAALRDGELDIGGHGWQRAIADAGLAPPTVWDREPRVEHVPDDWRTDDDPDASHPTLAGAWQHARHHGTALPVHGTDSELDTAGV
jgi:hypothetical protein